MSDLFSTILIVDCKKATRTLLRTGLRDLGYKFVVEALNPDQALAIIGERAIDLIISEMGRDLEGLRLLRSVRSLRQHGHIPFIVVTSRAEANLVQEAKNAGVTGYIARPFALRTLQQRIDAALKGAA